MTVSTLLWPEANQCYLTAALAGIRRVLASRSGCDAPEEHRPAPDLERIDPPPALETVVALFGLTPFERGILLLCAGMELDGSFSPLCAAAQGDPGKGYPTFGLALAALPGAHWNALSPEGPLRYWRLIDLLPGGGLTHCPLRIDERILHHLAGVRHLDGRLDGLAVPEKGGAELVESHRALAERAASIWCQAAGGDFPPIQLFGNDQPAQRAIASAVCSRFGLELFTLPAAAVPVDPKERGSIIRLWQREAVLSQAALFIDCNGLEAGEPQHIQAITDLMDRLHGAIFLGERERSALRNQRMVTLEVNRPTFAEQRHLWGAALKGTDVNEAFQDAVAAQFNLGASRIREIAAQEAPGRDGATAAFLWDACRSASRPDLSDLAQRVIPAAAWDDLVLPESQSRLLREIVVHVRQRAKVYQTWGFAGRGGRGLGISALFSGDSGTGKTMAAEVLASELQLDLYRIDLSQVVSKYIGETEKNLRRVFDAAEDGGAILLFDEADALFGKRSEVKDSHDRYANVEVSYLLQRMEAYRGLAILTTNMKQSLDTAFLRRIRFAVSFPFPGAPERAEIWRRVFPPQLPLGRIDLEQLARLNIAGGNIRNIALYASFLAAEAGEPLNMRHLARAAIVEYAKLEKPLSRLGTEEWA